MKNSQLLYIAIVAVLSAVVVVAILKYLGYESPVVIGGGVAGGIAGAISANMMKKKEA